MRSLAVLSLLACLSTPAMAQDRASTVLVLDGSGSMWGQIEGVAKITIAQDVVDELLQVIPADQALGLTVYGHRRKGDCTDIETMVSPAIGTQAAISAAVHAIKPKGKTPMTDAVIAAAQSLRYTEEKATVILVSDGIETCNPDPCAAARALEEAGVDFTAHVIGFDVSEPDAVAQMKCMAAETGGTFRMASDAKELGAALVEVVAAPEPVTITFRATVDGAEIGTGLVWSFTPEGTGAQTAPTGTTQLSLLPGDYTVSVLRLEDEATAETAFTVTEQAATVTLALPALTPAAALDAPETAVAGSAIEVTWMGPDNGDDYIALAAVGAKVDEAIAYAYTNNGNPAELTMPVEPGSYELRYIADGKVQKILASRQITGTAPSASLEAPETVVAGSEIEVTWTGPANSDDYIVLAEVGAKADETIDYYPVRSGTNPVKLDMPVEPGTYELRYSAGDGQKILATRQITGTAPSASLKAPETVVAGSEVEVTWTGPANSDDYIVLAEVGSQPRETIDYYPVRSGTNPVKLDMPVEPGTYELRYSAGDGQKILATRQITGTAAEAALDAPETVVAGSEIEVTWTGPANNDDYIVLAEVGSQPRETIDYYPVRNGANPVKLDMPVEPGTYELRYSAGDGQKILATRQITGTAPEVALEAPGTVSPEAEFEVVWLGPNNQNDSITLAAIGSDAGDYLDHRYASSGNPAPMTAPAEPGTYVLRYVAYANEQKVLARRIVTVAGAAASDEVALEAAESAEAGGQIEVFWAGPGAEGDLIAIRKIGSDVVETSAAAASGNPATLQLPSEPGSYLLHYLSGPEKQSLAKRLVQVN